MPGFSKLIDDFGAGLQGGPVPAGVTATSATEVERRFAVYRNNVAHSLSQALGRRFPVIERLVGAQFFAALAQAYLKGNRPRSPVLLEWGDSFAGFLRDFPPLAGYPYMADVARIEYARGIAFHAADGIEATSRDFMTMDPDTMGLKLHASVQVLRLAHAAVTIWAQNQPGQTPAPIDPTRPEIALILRARDYSVPVVAISAADAAMIDALKAGAPLTASATVALTIDPHHDAHAVLQHLMRVGAICTPLTEAR